ncbi:DNA-binding transcriptional regulator, GntR family [Paramicrobacterium humi]|uniref:DNA-binding transcriptional regulator, GntR family n=1 Tax=Paramicrobacterium humi TaxID=640635 RepID=A0A1H4LDM2_9MICO|nr:GntR family transcriptional regulator [Microbacterium humi]SEB68302.1 DNA-binding transcriptional regulator, GntR family [Microbacterium humi]
MASETSAQLTASGSDTALADQISAEILRWIVDEDLPAGFRLTERAVAERFKVSRSPSRRALQRLQRDGHIDRTDTGRYVVSATRPNVVGHSVDEAATDEDLYLRVARERLEGALPERISQSALARRYDLSPSRAGALLQRLSMEGWAAPLPGHGWEFLPVLTSIGSYQASYRFRLIVEPMAVLEPTFELDRVELLKRRDEQQQLVDGDITRVTPSEHFELNAAFHATLARCSRNEFVIESLARVNRLRRLIEYRQALVPERAVIRCREHVAIADLVLAGKLDAASGALRDHISSAAEEKSVDRAR